MKRIIKRSIKRANDLLWITRKRHWVLNDGVGGCWVLDRSGIIEMKRKGKIDKSLGIEELMIGAIYDTGIYKPKMKKIIQKG